MTWRLIAGLIAMLGISAAWAADPVSDALAEMVEHHRQMIVLLEGVEEGDPDNERIFAARNQYARKLDTSEWLTQQAEQAPPERSVSDLVARFLDGTPTLHDADKLAFGDLLDDLLLIESERDAPASLVGDLQRLTAELDAILATYRKEIGALYARLGVRGEKTREAWSDYIASLHTLYSAEQLVEAFRRERPLLNEERTRSGAPAKKDPTLLWGLGLPEKTVVLTFDDGPHRSRTDAVLDVLKRYQVHGYFFSVGRKLGKLSADGKPTLTRDAKVAKRVIAEGHVIANHSFSHPVLTKLKPADQAEELIRTNAMIAAIAKQKATFFRPPYGSKDKTLLEAAKAEGMSAVMWNIDSMDWADPVPESIVRRILEQLEKQQRGIVLFHDIHKPTVAALPLLLDELNKRGFRVVALDGGAFAGGGTGVPFVAEEKPKPLYGNSWAVVIGINDYTHWPKLRYAVNDARSVAELLRTRLGFPAANVIELYDAEATRERIVQLLGDQLSDPKKVGPEDRVFIFFAGHGITRGLPSGRDLGYIIPVDADGEHYQARAISMSHLDDFSELIPAKHVYYVMDSCYSGLALTRAGGRAEQSDNYLTEITRRRARQILTAGGADQQVADGGPGGHSIFTWTLLQGLEGLADADGNGFVTAAELGTYVAPVVSSYAEQTPAFGNLVGSEGGEFVFQVDSTNLAAINEQLEAETRRLEDELQALRTETKDKLRKRLELQLALSREAGGESKVTRSAALDDRELTEERIRQARRLNASALQYLSENRYEQALAELGQAAELNPYNPTILNNYGFVLSKLERHEEALVWYDKTVELEPERKVVYLNLGDSLMALGRTEEAATHYERYLQLFPSSPKAADIRELLAGIATQSVTHER